MAETDKKFDVEIITPDRVFFKGEADMLEFNTSCGEIGVFKDHIPLTTVLEPGLVTIHRDGEQQVAAVHAGFAEILGDKVTLLAYPPTSAACEIPSLPSGMPQEKPVEMQTVLH